MSDQPENVIATDHPLTDLQQAGLTALLDTLLPASEDGVMPSAAEVDLIAHLRAQAEAFIPALHGLLNGLPDGFAQMSYADRHGVVQAISQAQQALFDGLLAHVYTCYYQQDKVMAGIGMSAGPPFPRGNTVEAGDLSLLDPVIEKSKTYRK